MSLPASNPPAEVVRFINIVVQSVAAGSIFRWVYGLITTRQFIRAILMTLWGSYCIVIALANYTHRHSVVWSWYNIVFIALGLLTVLVINFAIPKLVRKLI